MYWCICTVVQRWQEFFVSFRALSSVWCNYVAANAVVRCRTVRWLAVTTSSAQSSGSTSTASASPTNRRANGSVLDVAALGRLLWIPTCWLSSRNDLNDRRRRSVILTRWLPLTDEARVLLFSLYARAIDKTVASCRPPCSNSQFTLLSLSVFYSQRCWGILFSVCWIVYLCT